VRSFRLRPRYRGVAWTAIGTGSVLTGAAIATMGAALAPILMGTFGIGLGAFYLWSPTWRLAVVVDDHALEVTRRFRLPWKDVVKVVASPSTKTCFVDGGAPGKSLIVPGVGAPAPYSIDGREELYAEILAHVDPAKVQEVTTLEAR
jgi:hypothetical protein